jgi:hypothetical protein
MKQYRITTENLTTDSDDDCYLAPDDPIQELKIAGLLGGLGSEARLQEYRANQAPVQANLNDNARIQREQNIKPGTPEWFALWFAQPRMP